MKYPSPQSPEPIRPSAANDQAASIFADECERIQRLNPKIDWLRPSLADIDRELLDRATIDVGASEGDTGIETVVVGAGALRGIILHKLMEELLTGLLIPAHLNDRASTLAQEVTIVGAAVPDPSELAATVLRTFSHEKLKPYIAKMVPEIPLYGARSDTVLISARADAIAFEGGAPVAVFDWKSADAE
jgi:CRISPR-associated exonuclease Cas4